MRNPLMLAARRHLGGGTRPAGRRPGNQGRRRAFRLDRLRAADARQGGRDLQEERPRRLAEEDSAEGPAPRDRLGRRPVRGDDGRDLDRLERQRRRDHADLPARQELRRRRHGRAQQRREDRRPQGQDRRRIGAGHGAVLHARVVPEEERPVGQGRHRRQSRARPGGAGLRRRPERRGDELRAVPVDGARQSAGRQDHRDDARLPDDHGHLRLHAEVPRRESEGGEGARRQLLRGPRHDRQGAEEELRDHGRRRQADGRAVRGLAEVPALAGPGGEPGVLRRPACSSSARRPPTCCSRSGSSGRSPTSSTLADTRFIQ